MPAVLRVSEKPAYSCHGIVFGRFSVHPFPDASVQTGILHLSEFAHNIAVSSFTQISKHGIVNVLTDKVSRSVAQ